MTRSYFVPNFPGIWLTQVFCHGNRARFNLVSTFYTDLLKETWYQEIQNGNFVKKNSVFRDTTPCNPFKVPTFQRNLSPQSSKSWNKPRNLANRFILISCLSYASTWRWRRHVPPKRLLTFDGLQVIASQKTEFFITTAVRTWTPTMIVLLLCLYNLWFLNLK
jgi:hypothetical protein